MQVSPSVILRTTWLLLCDIVGFQEAALSTVGEFGWHLFVLIFTVTCHSLYFSHLALQEGASATVTCAVGGDGTCTHASGSPVGEL
jgi:hypothetical protein